MWHFYGVSAHGYCLHLSCAVFVVSETSDLRAQAQMQNMDREKERD
jgi:hypothetical protein